ncbi:hypothetical protein [Hathewaya limosa]|uniref:Uncharacterized protein n=1 Tax=Hathewaya limosa TaxID=1536 RepID=A0ABU0JRZ3_HATLI|nr:hypothetical protein [Hathewaya limosa]MDQ0478854.1 hypothetical protein [Hathewaya limosa]
MDFSGISFKDSSTEVVYYNQADARWKDKDYEKISKLVSYIIGNDDIIRNRLCI